MSCTQRASQITAPIGAQIQHGNDHVSRARTPELLEMVLRLRGSASIVAVMPQWDGVDPGAVL